MGSSCAWCCVGPGPSSQDRGKAPTSCLHPGWLGWARQPDCLDVATDNVWDGGRGSKPTRMRRWTGGSANRPRGHGHGCGRWDRGRRRDGRGRRWMPWQGGAAGGNNRGLLRITIHHDDESAAATPKWQQQQCSLTSPLILTVWGGVVGDTGVGGSRSRGGAVSAQRERRAASRRGKGSRPWKFAERGEVVDLGEAVGVGIVGRRQERGSSFRGLARLGQPVPVLVHWPSCCRVLRQLKQPTGSSTGTLQWLHASARQPLNNPSSPLGCPWPLAMHAPPAH